jgi:hypothetical protein
MLLLNMGIAVVVAADHMSRTLRGVALLPEVRPAGGGRREGGWG